MKETFDCIIIGGGISGLTFAARLGMKNRRVLIAEKSTTLGGRIRTCYPAGMEASFPLELGAHTCYNTYTHLIALATDVGAYPYIAPLFNLGYRTSVDGELKSLASQIAYFPLLCAGFRMLGTRKCGKTASAYFRPIVGNANYDRLFRYVFRAVLSQEADHYPAELFLKKRSKRMGDVPRRFNFERGLSQLVERLADASNADVRIDTEIRQLSKDGDLFVATGVDGTCYQAKHIALSVDPQTAAMLLHPLETDVAALFAAIDVSRSVSAGVLIACDSASFRPLNGIIPLSEEWFSAVSCDGFPEGCLASRGITFHFPDNKQTDEALLDIIYRTLQVSPADLLRFVRTQHVLPAMRPEHTGMAARVEAARRDNRIFLLGNYYYGLSLEDCVIRAEEEARRYLTTTAI